MSSLRGPSATEGAAIHGCCGDDSGDDDEAAAWGRPLPQRLLSSGERRVVRQAPWQSTAADAAARGSCAANRSAH